MKKNRGIFEKNFRSGFLNRYLNRRNKLAHWTPTVRDRDLKREFMKKLKTKIAIAKRHVSVLQRTIKGPNLSNNINPTQIEYEGSKIELDQLKQMLKRQIEFIKHLQASKENVLNNTYNVCPITGKFINNMKLKAVYYSCSP